MSSEEQSKTPAQPVGQQLRRARERLGLSVSAIADEQHLRTSVIEAIEDGDFSKVDTELFLKGYIRAYAQHVGLDANAIIRDLDAELEPLREDRERQHDADPLVDIERKKRRKQRVARAVVVILVLAAAGFAVSTYLADGTRRLPGFGAGQAPDTTENKPETEVSSTEPEFSDEPSDITAPETLAVDSVTGEAELEDSDAASRDVMVSSVIVDEDPTVPEVPQNDPAEVAAIIEAQTPESASSEPAQETEPATEQVPAVDEVAVSSADLRMTFSDDCWVQVSDANGNRLVSTLKTSGDSLAVSGEAPLSIVVGAMSALTSIEFQGEPVELNSIRAVNDRAEFTLEP